MNELPRHGSSRAHLLSSSNSHPLPLPKLDRAGTHEVCCVKVRDLGLFYLVHFAFKHSFIYVWFAAQVVHYKNGANVQLMEMVNATHLEFSILNVSSMFETPTWVKLLLDDFSPFCSLN